MNEVSKVIVFLVLVVFFSIIILIIAEKNELFLEYRNSKLNNKTYGIQETFNKSDDAVEMLAKLHNEMDNFIKDKWLTNDSFCFCIFCFIFQFIQIFIVTY